MKAKNALYAPLLLCVIYLLTGFSDRLIGFFSEISDNQMLSMIIIQCLVFLLPVAFYCRVRNINFITALNLKPVRPSILGFALLSFLLYFTGGAILKYVSQAFFGNPVSDNLGVSAVNASPQQTAMILLAYVLLPAFLEELVFRSILIHEYASYGGFFAITVSALSFAMLHFSFAGFAEYFLAGVIFACVTFVCGSVLPAMLLHLLNNALTVFFPDFFSQYVARTGNSVVLFYLLVGAFLLFLYLWFAQLEYIYHKKAEDFSRDRRAQLLLLENEKKLQQQEQRPRFLSRARQVFLSPGLLAAVALFVVKSFQLI